MTISAGFRNLYIHVPFCRGKCGYCAFYSHPEPDPVLMNAWLERIRRDLRNEEPRLQNVHTVYFGGGTPSLLPAETLRELFRAVSRHIRLTPGAEVTMEATPESVTPERCAAAAGFVNRVSMGVQSFFPELLKNAGRRSMEAGTVERAVELWRGEAGLENLGIDLIFALPGETLAMWKSDLQRAVELPIRHISAYSLMIEDGTPLAGSGYHPDEVLSADMWEFAGSFLAAHGFPRYEISNYAAENFQARHNQNIWHGETYLGLGPAASGFDGIDRITEVPSLPRWLTGAPPERDAIPRSARRREIFIMGLRTVRGWAPGEFQEVTGEKPDFPELLEAKNSGLIETDDAGAVRPTAKGLAFWNDLAEMLL